MLSARASKHGAPRPARPRPAPPLWDADTKNFHIFTVDVTHWTTCSTPHLASGHRATYTCTVTVHTHTCELVNAQSRGVDRPMSQKATRGFIYPLNYVICPIKLPSVPPPAEIFSPLETSHSLRVVAQFNAARGAPKTLRVTGERPHAL